MEALLLAALLLAPIHLALLALAAHTLLLTRAPLLLHPTLACAVLLLLLHALAALPLHAVMPLV